MSGFVFQSLICITVTNSVGNNILLAAVCVCWVHRYTLFGDTINTASRMESTSLPGYIQCSQRTADLIREQDTHCEICVECRGTIKIKGKGEMTTYWILLPGQDPPTEVYNAL